MNIPSGTVVISSAMSAGRAVRVPAVDRSVLDIRSGRVATSRLAAAASVWLAADSNTSSLPSGLLPTDPRFF